MDRCFQCGELHARGYIDKRYCCRRCQVADLGLAGAERANRLAKAAGNGVILLVFGVVALVLLVVYFQRAWNWLYS